MGLPSDSKAGDRPEPQSDVGSFGKLLKPRRTTSADYFVGIDESLRYVGTRLVDGGTGGFANYVLQSSSEAEWVARMVREIECHREELRWTYKQGACSFFHLHGRMPDFTYTWVPGRGVLMSQAGSAWYALEVGKNLIGSCRPLEGILELPDWVDCWEGR